MKKIKISYLIALYNKQKYIKDCIKSILDEECNLYDLEICIVDDGSTDESVSVILENFSNNSKIKIYVFKSNQGKVSAYNEAYQMSTGDYICIMGADDLVVKGRTRKLLSKSCTTGGVVYGNALKFNNAEITVFTEILRPPKKASYLDNILSNEYSGGCFISPRLLMNEVMPIPTYLKFEDWWIANNFLKKKVVSVIDESVTLYRIHDSNDCGSNEATIQVKRRDASRHFLYLNEILNNAENKIEWLYAFRSLAIRNSICGRRVNYLTLLLPPYNLTTLKIFLYMIFRDRVYIIGQFFRRGIHKIMFIKS